MDPVLFAFLLTLFAGLSTGIGSLIAFFSKSSSPRFLALCLSFSAGVMLYVSMIEIFAKGQEALSAYLGAQSGAWVTLLAFFGGMLLIKLVDRFIPKPDEKLPATPLAAATAGASGGVHNARLLRMGLYSAVAIGAHNFPEGLATFISALQDPVVAVPVAVAIAIHNIPEGIAVSVPIYYATGSKKKALFYSLLSGLTEPLGALIGYLLLMPWINDFTMGLAFALVAGIMVLLSLGELIPEAQRQGGQKLTMGGLVAGMAVMSVSLALFA